ncbi:MAG TPA: transcription termination/antitermination protein NusG [Candidatus Azoamicus sp. OHIO2]
MKRWYVIHVMSSKEDEITKKIKKKISEQHISNLFGNILVPFEEFIEIKSGKKEKGKRNFFPGYIFIEMSMNYRTWFLVKHTDQVIGFVGSNVGTPIAVSNEEVEMIIEKMNQSFYKPKHKKSFNLGEMIRVIDGPFSEFNGTVEEIYYSKNKLCVGVLIFGRSTPIDLNFNQVEKF